MIDGENKFVLENVYNVSMSEADMQYCIKPAVLLNYLQDMAAKSINNIDNNLSNASLLSKGFAWCLIRYRLEFDDYPQRVAEIKVKTESRGCNKMTAYRDFECYNNKTGERLLRAVTSWFIVDTKEKSIVNIMAEYPDFPKFEKRNDDLTLRKIKPIECIDYQKLFHVRYDDLDMNGHVNNTVYVTWAMEALDYAFRTQNKLKTLDIYFKHEAKYGDEILSLVKIDNEKLITEHLIKNANTGDELCLIKAEFTKC